MAHPLVQTLHQEFMRAAHAETAAAQAAYMRNQFTFLGLKAPVRRELQKEIFKEYPISTERDLIHLTTLLWQFEHREFQYAALDLMIKWRKYFIAQSLPFLALLICAKSHWDTVDHLAAHCVYSIIARYPELLTVMDTWITHDNMWLRRSALICQLKSKKSTDEQRLFSYCKQTMHEKEFFIRKAIGWALREYSKTSPHEVQSFIHMHRNALSTLSIKEGSKYL